MNQFEIKRAGIEEIDLIEPLWDGLRRLHRELSPHFKDRFDNMTWDGRKRTLLDKSNAVLFEYAIDTADNLPVGYCISTIADDGKTGEIDSIFVDERYRESGIGRLFVENAIAWLDSHEVQTQKLLVGVGNEQVLGFYEKFDFHPLHIVLQRKKK
jgi:ribosomal protein S18 acetylase RimI-like enzyme